MFAYLFVFASLICFGQSTVGVDVSQYISQWSCLKQNGVEFAIVRGKLHSLALTDLQGYQSGGHLDPNAAANVRNAKAAGIRYVDVYLFPCVPCRQLIFHLIDLYRWKPSWSSSSLGQRTTRSTLWNDLD